MADIQSATAENMRGKKEKKTRKEIETTAAKYNGLPYWAAIKSHRQRRKQNPICSSVRAVIIVRVQDYQPATTPVII